MKVAAIQAAPVFLDRAATAQKVLMLMKEASDNGAELCVFPETFIPGYPIWVEPCNGASFFDPAQKKAYAGYIDAAVDIDGPEIIQIVKQAKSLGLFTYLGIAELSRSKGTIYPSLVAIHPEKGIVSVHRKLAATHHERLVWGSGDGNGLRVHPWKNARVGGLNCFENWMPLARHSLYAQGEDIHVAVWPGHSMLTQDISRFVAMEGRVFVICAGGVLLPDHIPDTFPLKSEIVKDPGFGLNGGSIIVGPNGEVLAEPVIGKETILYADLDLTLVREARQVIDPAGHYNRPDVFNLRVSRQRLEPVQFNDDIQDDVSPLKQPGDLKDR